MQIEGRRIILIVSLPSLLLAQCLSDINIAARLFLLLLNLIYKALLRLVVTW
jgi:hypothetical protein